MFQQEWAQIIESGGELLQMILDYEEEAGYAIERPVEAEHAAHC